MTCSFQTHYGRCSNQAKYVIRLAYMDHDGYICDECYSWMSKDEKGHILRLEEIA